MSKPASLSLLLMLLCGLTSHAIAELPDAVQRSLNRFDLEPTGVSVLVRNLDSGEIVLSHNPETPRNPASTMKLLTTYATLDTLTPGHVWTTDVLLLGELRPDGTLEGDLALRGGGDPYLVEETLLQLLTELRRRGVRAITGDIVIDNSLFALADEDPAAFDGEPLRAYNVAPNALLVNFKVVRFWFEPEADGSGVRITALPDLPNLKIVNNVRLKPGRCRGYMRGIEMHAEPDGDEVRFSGTFPTGCRRYSFGRTLLDHDSYAYGLIRRQWELLGGTLAGGVRHAVLDPELEPLLRWRSRPYSDLIRLINKHSNNVMTRQVFLTLGAHYFGEPATLPKARQAIDRWLAEHALEFPELVIDNGSGLSRDARLTAADLISLLQLAWHSPFMPEFMSSLSLVGTDGTFRRRHRRNSLAGQAHLKTGRLDDVTAMAGYLRAADGTRYALAMLHNDTDVHRGGGEAAQDALLRWLYNYTPAQAPAIAAAEPAAGAEP